MRMGGMSGTQQQRFPSVWLHCSFPPHAILPTLAGLPRSLTFPIAASSSSSSSSGSSRRASSSKPSAASATASGRSALQVLDVESADGIDLYDEDEEESFLVGGVTL
jgi:hypothetical protein